MKSTFHALILGLLTLLPTACKQASEKDKGNGANPTDGEIVPAPKDIISLAEAQVLYTNYSEHRAVPITAYEAEQRSAENTFEPARFVDFDYATLKQYMEYVEQEARKAGVKEITSLRHYFANYPENGELAKGEKAGQTGKNTIFIVPTMVHNGREQGFYIDANGKAAPIRKSNAVSPNGLGKNHGNKTDKKAHAGWFPTAKSAMPPQGGKSLALNRGHSGPPPHTDF
ncbi:hypothetical protein [Maribacter sp. 2307ULW6-5]|uniref:hypothetical protein n=1 Tax=Maribacter sp. 2307ULW6-5 TaxID=3386275 RepID=UPI0039BC84EC